MAEFYVNQTPSDQHGHLVHNKDCAILSNEEKTKYLGSFSTAQAAFNKAKGFYDPVTYCPDCLKTE